MPYAKLLDDFHSSPKVMQAGLDGAGLFARSLSFCGAYLTDGFVPKEWAEATAGKRQSLLAKLVQVGLWEKVPGGFQIPDFLEFNPSKAEFVALQVKKAEAGKKGAMNRWHGSKRHGNSNDTSDSSSHDNSDDTSDGKTIAPRAGALPLPLNPKPKKNHPPTDVVQYEAGGRVANEIEADNNLEPLGTPNMIDDIRRQLAAKEQT